MRCFDLVHSNEVQAKSSSCLWCIDKNRYQHAIHLAKMNKYAGLVRMHSEGIKY